MYHSLRDRNTYRKFIDIEPYFHGLLWCMVLFYPYLKYMGREGGYPMSFLHELNSLFFKMTIAYFLYLWFFPKKGKVKYIPLVLLVFVGNILTYGYVDQLFHPRAHDFWLNFVSQSLTYIGFGFVFFTLYTNKSGYLKQQEINQLVHEKQQAEIRAIKAQVNPHFLFNTLNTIYANALKKEDKVPGLILKLSNGFRYMLHEGEKEYVEVKQEIRHLKDFVQLQEERLQQKVNVTFTAKIDDERQPIAPLLYIGFVENAFKYTSILKGKRHNIDIQVKLKQQKLTFLCTNPFDEKVLDQIDSDWKESGIGLKNTKERLRLLYPEKHTLTIVKDAAIFKVRLEIHL